MFRRLFALIFAFSLLAGPAAAESPEAGDSTAEAAQTIFEPIPWDVKVSPYLPHEECFLPDGAGYHDDSLDIRVETIRRFDTTVTCVYVTIADPSQLRCELSQKFPSKTATVVPTMAKRVNAVLAVNGDYFIYHNEGISVRNGTVYRVKPNRRRDTLIIDDKGDFTIISPTTREAWESFEGTVVHAFCFGPALVINGQQLTDVSQLKLNVGKNKRIQRCAIGQLGPLSYLIVATEGPENKGSKGFTILQLAELCAELGCINAYNLDGASSSSVVLNYRKINALSTGKKRPVGDCIWFATLVP
ncbi:MAG: phosphodiester glycosidase family protein [Clostridia bacterium]|nr:phosphodiester glycosidase family protein [Clostridia bacterium]